MKSRISYFNATALRKDITRFWPVWGLYSVGLLIVLLIFGQGPSDRLATLYDDLTMSLGVVNLIYGTVCAVVLFSDLFNSRMCNALHAMPLRREGWFLVHLTAGMLFCLVPNLVFALISALMLGEFFFVAFLVLAVTVLQFLFFFGLATLCCMCAGSRFAAFALSGLSNFLSLLVYVLLVILYQSLLHGLRIPDQIFLDLCPVIQLVRNPYFEIVGDYYAPFYTVRWEGFCPGSWYTLFLFAGLGLVFLGLGILVYRKRHLERAGEFLSVRCLRPVFLVLCSFSGAAFLYFFGMLFGITIGYTFLTIGFVVGFFGALMFLNRTVKVFRRKSFVSLALVLALLLGSMGLTRMDVLGIVSYVPDTEDIEKLQVIAEDAAYYYEDSHCVDLTDPDRIDEIRDLHQTLIDLGYQEDFYNTITLRYHLKDGRTVDRYYDIGTDESYDILRPYFSDWRCVFSTDDWEGFQQKVIDISTYGPEPIPRELYPQVLEAMKKDCEAGNMAQPHFLHKNEGVKCWIGLYLGNFENERSICIYECCSNTLEVLKPYID